MKQLKQEQETAEFEIGELLGIAMTFVVIGIALTYGLVAQSDVRADVDRYDCLYTYTYLGANANATAACFPSNETFAGNYTHSIAPSGTSAAYTGATDSINATAKFASKLGLIVTIVVAAVIIGILVRYLWVKFA